MRRKNVLRWLNLVMALVMLLSLVPVSATAQVTAVDAVVPVGQDVAEVTSPDAIPQIKASIGRNQQVQKAASVVGETDPNGIEPAIYIVQLTGAPLATYSGNVADLAATSPRATGARKLDSSAEASRAYLTYLDSQRSSVRSAMASSLSREVEIKFEYTHAFNGFAAVLTPQEAAMVVGLAGVKMVQRDAMRYAQTDAGPQWINAPGLWDGTDTMGLPAAKGEGVVVGIIDEGINMDHPSFATLGGDGYVHTNPRSQKYGVCDPTSDVYDASFQCTEKLIGAWDFADGFDFSLETDGPEDNGGHGSHTGSTTAGNVIDPATLNAPTTAYRAKISGVAPHANIISYDGLTPGGGTTSMLVASIDQATKDQVDVINYSIGGGASDPWTDADSLAFLAAMDAGVVPVTSNGNSGPGPSTVGSPANAPWMLSVGASTHDRKPVNALINMTGGDTTPPGDIQGQSVTAGYGPAPIVYAGNYTSTGGILDAKCLSPFAAGTFNGEIVVCDRGTNARVDKSANVKAGGAGGMVLTEVAATGSIVSDAHSLPAVHIGYTDGEAVKAWLASGSVHTATIAGTTYSITDTNGDIMAGFSSRGPNPDAGDVIKPDITAPGVDILAAYRNGEEYNMISGTSMSSPHMAGAAALMKQLYPAWSPAAIKSALMMTSKTAAVYKEDGTTMSDPFDRGAGRVDLSKAAKAGFVLDESASGFEAANPANGGDPTALNLASLGNSQCVGVCTWTRTLMSTQSTDVEWTVATADPVSMTLTVEPMTFTLAAGATQVVTITADTGTATLGDWAFGEVHFMPSAAGLPMAHFPVAVNAVAGKAPAGVTDVVIETRRNAGKYTVQGLQAVDITGLESAIYIGDTTVAGASIAQDPTNDDAYDLAAGGVYTMTVDATGGASRLAVEILTSTAPDLDLFVGLDENGNGNPDADEELCRSTSGSWNEFCVLPGSGESLASGVYWILVQNWAGSGAALDDFTVATTLVTNNTSSSLQLMAPADVSLGAAFDLDVMWNFPDLKAGESRFGLISLGTDAGNPTNIASLPVEIRRLADDVSVHSNVAPGAYVEAGDTVDFTVDVQPEITMAPNVTYQVTATVPAGLTYVDGSASVTPTLNGNQLVWQVDLATQPTYVMSTSATDANCAAPFSDGYVNLANFGIPAIPTISGDGFIETRGGGFSYFGQDYPLLAFTDDGVFFPKTIFGVNPGINSGNNVAIPNPANPNNLIAPFWTNLRVVYDQVANRGVTMATAGANLTLTEFDDVELVGDTGTRLDFEVAMLRQPSNNPGDYEIVFAYDNITGTLPAASIGIENADGSVGIAYTGVITDGMAICYDWKAPSQTVTFQAMVDSSIAANTVVTTTVDNSVNLPGTVPATGDDGGLFVTDVILDISMSTSPLVGPGEPISLTVDVTNNGQGTATNLVVEVQVPPATQHVSGGSSDGRVMTDTIASLAGGATTTLVFTVEPIPYGLATLQTKANVGGSRTPTIIGGEEATPGAWPWQVALMYASVANGFDAQFCGGSLLYPDVVVTAAHCVDGELASLLDVAVGRHTLSSNEGERIPANEILIHPGWDPNTYDNDIALVRLSRRAVLTDTVGMVRLLGLQESNSALAAPGTMATVTGWGARATGDAGPDYADALHQASLPLISHETCSFAMDLFSSVNAGETGWVTENMVCAGVPEGGIDTCSGDSGGPLVVPDGDSGWVQAGITSWGEGCAEPGLPGIYTKVENYGSWVMATTNSYTSYNYWVTDGSGQPGHSALGNDPVRTTVDPTLAANVVVHTPATAVVGTSVAVSATVANSVDQTIANEMVYFTDGHFYTELSGLNEVPAITDTTASGIFSLVVDPATGQASYTLTATGLISPTASHIHLAPAGTNGGVALWLYDATGAKAPGGSFPVTGTLTIGMDLLKTMIAGGAYVNIHTPAHRGGEIRGQIMGGQMATTNQDGAATVQWSSNQPADVQIWALADQAMGSSTVSFAVQYLRFLPIIAK